MNLTDIWFKHIENICEEYERLLITEPEFVKTIVNITNHPHSPIAGVSFQLISSEPFGEVLFDNSQATGEPTYVHTIDPFDNYGSSCKIKIWRKVEGTVDQQSYSPSLIIDHLSRLIRSFWKPNLRDDKTRLISLQYPEVNQKVEDSLPSLAQKTGTLYAFFCDLDNFKKVNDTYGQKRGDKAILEFASIVYKVTSPYAIAIHRSGDEFVVLYPAQDADDVLFLAKDVMQSVAKYDFGFSDVEVRVSAGITPLRRDYEAISYKELEERAEKVLKPSEEIKLRGQARIESQRTITPPASNHSSWNTALCIIKSCIHSPRPFESPWLNMISRYCHDLLNGKDWQEIDLQTNIDSLIQWIQPEIKGGITRAALPSSESGEFSPQFSVFDIVLAVAHGVFRIGLTLKGTDVGGKTLQIYHDNTQGDNVSLKLFPEKLSLVSFGNPEVASEAWDLGGFIYSPDSEHIDPLDTRRALLIKIGHSKLKIPTSIFIEELIVDDRPTRGGGLPDFWEATIAKLIAKVSTNTNVGAVYILGNHKHCELAVKKLKNIGSWKTDEQQISYKTGMSVPSINVAVDQLEGKIHFPSDEEQLINHLANVLKDSYELKPNSQPIKLHREHRFLQLGLDMTEIALESYDGCRVNTIAEAFPVVLEMARKLTSDEMKIVDQAGQELRELVDFKVHLKNPTKDLIPAFYEREEDSLEDYFKRQFLDETGLFGSIFRKSKQLEAVLKHLTEAITNPRHQFSTRRAVLVVPNEITPGEEFAPLGLISVRIIPRFKQNRFILNYSYTWRTVEALVGFPYSLYGSVRFSEYLTQELRNLLPQEHSRKLEMGELSYIAHSLHIFMDEHGQNIARTIVNNASF